MARWHVISEADLAFENGWLSEHALYSSYGMVGIGLASRSKFSVASNIPRIQGPS
jgi:hypothetical protein